MFKTFHSLIKRSGLKKEKLKQERGSRHLHKQSITQMAQRLELLEPDQALYKLLQLNQEQAIKVFEHLSPFALSKIILLLPPQKVAFFLSKLSANHLADIFSIMETRDINSILPNLDYETRKAISSMLKWPEGSAGRLMTTDYLVFYGYETVHDVRRQMLKTDPEVAMSTIYVVDEQGELQQSLSLINLCTAQPSQTLSDIASKDLVVVSPWTDREEVARMFRQNKLSSIPVVNEENKILGIVTIQHILEVIVVENTEDTQKFGGMFALHTPYLKTQFQSLLMKRSGWLCALFLSEMMTSSVLQHYDYELEKAVVLAMFLPLIISSGGNSGSQATALIVRALALNEIKLKHWFRVLLMELPMGFTLGCILAVIGITRIALWQYIGLYDYGIHWVLIALTVGTGLIGVVAFGSIIGAMLPFILKKLNFDPAIASAPFVATLVDVTGLLILFKAATLILKGTLL